MTFDYPGYELNFIQKEPCRDGSAHKFTLVYKFFSPVTRYFYILRADYHEGDVFAIKFYCKKDRHSLFKYSKIVNRGDLGNIIITCFKVVPLLLKSYPSASFGFAAARSIDEKTKKVEFYTKNQRFEIYRYISPLKFGMITFAHFEYEAISSYILVNRSCPDIDAKEREIVNMLSDTYNTLLDVT